MATIRITYCGMDGEGRTVTEARQDAARQIEAALTGGYTAKLIVVAGQAAVIYRDPRFGWGYALLTGRKDGESLHKASGYENVGICERRAREHLGQLAWDKSNDTEVLDAIHKDDRAQMVSWFAWQRRYAAFRAEGCDDTEAHQRACDYRFVPAGA